MQIRELMAAESRKDRRRITYDDIFFSTQISKTALTRLGNDREKRVALNIIDRLCDYFDCQPGELFIYVPETEEPS